MTTENALALACEKAAELLEIDWDGDQPFIRLDSIEAAIETAMRMALSTEQRGVRVKPLEWASEPPYSVARVPLLSIHYATECVWDNGKFLYCILSGNYVNQQFATRDEARAAAQADYEKRILSALLQEAPAPATEQPFVTEQERMMAKGFGFRIPTISPEDHSAQLAATEQRETAMDAKVRAAEKAFYSTTTPSMRAALEAASVSEAKPVAWRMRSIINGKPTWWQVTTEQWLADKRRDEGDEVEPLFLAALHPRKD